MTYRSKSKVNASAKASRSAANTSPSLLKSRIGALILSVVVIATLLLTAFGDVYAMLPMFDRTQAGLASSQTAQSLTSVLVRTLCNALLASLVVFIVIAIAKRFSGLIAGAVAGLPFTTVPSLVLLAEAAQPDYAIRAATSAMWGSAAYALFALCFAYLCTRLSAHATTLVSLALSLLIAWLFLAWPVSYREALVMTLLICVSVLWLLPKTNDGRDQALNMLKTSVISKPTCVTTNLSVIMSGSMAAFVTLSAAWLPANVAGLLIALPVIGTTLAYRTHVNEGALAVQQMLRGYVNGCVAKIVFCFIFAYLLRQYGVGISTMAAMSLCVASMVLLVSWSVRKQNKANATTSHSPLVNHTVLQKHTRPI
jgi:uncharacterized membrane protein (GlpM family)